MADKDPAKHYRLCETFGIDAHYNADTKKILCSDSCPYGNKCSGEIKTTERVWLFNYCETGGLVSKAQDSNFEANLRKSAVFSL